MFNFSDIITINILVISVSVINAIINTMMLIIIRMFIISITFIFCIPVAYWMASKINERWHDDQE